jgi:hypothetical protein
MNAMSDKTQKGLLLFGAIGALVSVGGFIMAYDFYNRMSAQYCLFVDDLGQCYETRMY